MPDDRITADIRYEMDEIREVLQPFFMSLELSGRSIPKMVGVSYHKEILYYTELNSGFSEMRIRPRSHWVFWSRYTINSYVYMSQQLYTLEEIPQQFAEVYNRLGDKTILHA